MKFVSSVAATFILFTANVYATELECIISHNSEPVSYMNVTTEIGKKVQIDNVEGVSAYVTQKDENFYSLEAFMYEYDIRGYSEGMIRNASDKLTFSLWGRTSLTDISCTLAKK
jgi:hypothetical protein